MIKVLKYLIIAFIFLFVFASKVSAQVVINEFLPNPIGEDGNGNEWVELFNSGDTSEDLSQYFFDDDTNFDDDIGSAKMQLVGILESKGLCYVSLSTYLNNSGGDNAVLFRSDKSILDSYSYTTTTESKSFSRVPDGGTWQSEQTPTKSTVSCSSLAPTPTPTPTSTSTPTHTPTATPNPTVTPTKTPTPTPTKSPTPKTTTTSSPTSTSEELVLGIQNTSTSTPTPQEETVAKKKFPIFPVILIVTGFLCIAGALFFFVRNNVKKDF